jgi:(E)-benzylidenesuccinyl-CoA hydratase
MPDFKNIIYEKKGRIAVITINRPERMNAVDPATSHELLSAWSDFRDDNELWVAVFTGAGERAFSAGLDLVAVADAFNKGMEGAFKFDVPFGGITRGFEIFKPMIAAINGHCLAGGLEMALCCDIRIAAENATFGLMEVARAIIPGAGGTQRLPRAIGLPKALELIITASRIDAQTALRYGVVSQVVPLPELMPKAMELAEVICQNGPIAVRLAKEAACRGYEMTLKEGLALEEKLSDEVWRTEDSREGPVAFAQKRKPEYKGR